MKLVATILLLFALSHHCIATNLQGQVLRLNPQTGSYFPLVGVRVDLWIFNGQQWVDLSYAVTGANGSYLFVNVPPGLSFRMQVFGNFFPAQALVVMNVYPPYVQTVPSIIT